MAAPNCYLPGTTYMITRRVAQRQLRLRPTSADPSEDLIRRIFVYCVGWAAKRTGVQVHAMIVMGNHWHAVVTDPGTMISEFMHHVHLFVSKLLNVKQEEGENLWAVGPGPPLGLVRPEDVLRKLVYLISNAVAANLVLTPEEYPALHTTAADVGVRAFVARRPRWFFRQPTADGKKAKSRKPIRTPDQVKLEITKPPAFADLSDEGFRSLLQEAVDENVAQLRADCARRPLGPGGVLAQDPRSRPGPAIPDRKVSPSVACKNTRRRIEALARTTAFRAHHRDASKRWKAAKSEEERRAIVFPAGTYWMRVHFGVTCEPFTDLVAPAEVPDSSKPPDHSPEPAAASVKVQNERHDLALVGQLLAWPPPGWGDDSETSAKPCSLVRDPVHHVAGLGRDALSTFVEPEGRDRTDLELLGDRRAPALDVDLPQADVLLFGEGLNLRPHLAASRSPVGGELDDRPLSRDEVTLEFDPLAVTDRLDQ